jgi:transposase
VGVAALEVDETAFRVASATHATEFATGLVDLTRTTGPARLLDAVPGRSGTVLSAWLRERDAGWHSRVTVAALDPFRGYAGALRSHLPDAVRVLDAFRVIELGVDAVDQLRRRVQQETLGHPLIRLAELLARFTVADVSNGPTEAMDLLIKKVKRVGHGFRNFTNYRLRLLLHCGTVWDAPATTMLRGRLHAS